MKIDDAKLDELEALEKAASPMGWILCHHWKEDVCACGGHRGYIWHPDEERVVAQMGCERDSDGAEGYADVGQDGMRADARLLVAARNALPDLIADLRELQAERDRYRTAMNHAVMGITLALQVHEDIEARGALDELCAALETGS